MAASFSTIDTTIRRALLGEGDESKARYVSAFVHARRWFESEYAGGVEKAYGNKTVPLEVGPDRVVDLPSDYVEWNMIGIRRGEQLYNLAHNPRLVQIPEAEARPTAGLNELDAFSYAYHGLGADGVDVVTGYGRPTMRPGEFSIDRASRTLLVSSAISGGQELYLSYLSDEAACNGETLIHQLAEPWLEFYVLHFLHKRKNPGLAADYWRDAERSRSEYLLKRTPWGPEDLYTAMRNTLAQRK